jgi:hypothetical protein
MNQESGKKDVQAIYPQYINTYEQQDEISLVDLWIALLKFKKVYLWSFIFSIMVGISAVTLLSTPQYLMTTVMEMVSHGGKPIEPPEVVINKINTVILPQLARDTEKTGGLAILELNVSNPKATNLIVITNKVTENQKIVFSEFQSEVSARLINIHQDMLYDLNSALRKAIEIEKRLRPEDLTREAYVKEFRPDVWHNIVQLEDRIKAKVKFTDPGHDNADLAALERMMLVTQEVGALMDQKISLVENLDISFDLYRADVKVSDRKILELKGEIQNKLTKIISQSELSLKPVNPSKSLLYSIVILLSIFLAIAFTLVIMFRAKVIERMAEEA